MPALSGPGPWRIYHERIFFFFLLNHWPYHIHLSSLDKYNYSCFFLFFFKSPKLLRKSHRASLCADKGRMGPAAAPCFLLKTLHANHKIYTSVPCRIPPSNKTKQWRAAGGGVSRRFLSVWLASEVWEQASRRMRGEWPRWLPEDGAPWTPFSSSGERSQGPPWHDQRALRWRKGGTQDLKVNISPGELKRNESKSKVEELTAYRTGSSIPDPD